MYKLMKTKQKNSQLVKIYHSTNTLLLSRSYQVFNAFHANHTIDRHRPQIYSLKIFRTPQICRGNHGFRLRYSLPQTYQDYRCRPGDVGFVVRITGLWPQAWRRMGEEAKGKTQWNTMKKHERDMNLNISTNKLRDQQLSHYPVWVGNTMCPNPLVSCPKIGCFSGFEG